MIVEAVNFIAIAPAAAAKVSDPDSNGVRPNPICSKQRQQEGDGADADAEDEAADHAGEEGRRLQEREVDDRVRIAPGVADVGDEQRRPADDQRRDRRAPERVAADDRQAEDQG